MFVFVVMLAVTFSRMPLVIITTVETAIAITVLIGRLMVAVGFVLAVTLLVTASVVVAGIVAMIAVIVVILFVVKGLTGGAGGDRSSSALDVLNERYARGEIDAAEYNERKKNISGKG